MLDNFKNVLVLAPHTDDGELGAGGTIAKLVRNGARVTYVAFSTAAESVPAEFPSDVLKHEVKAATAVLGIAPDDLIIFDYKVRQLNYCRQDILEQLIKIRRERKFDLVLLPSTSDMHQDHKTVSEEGIRAFKGTTVLGYELNWNQLEGFHTCFVKLIKSDVETKINSIKEYKSQFGRGYCKEDYLHSLAVVRGTQVGADFAECFEVIRLYL